MTRLKEQPHRIELGTEEVKIRVLDEVKKICPTGAVAFSGGEFLLRKDALELLEYNAKIGLYSFINTCGTLLTPELLKDINKAAGGRITFGLSLDSIEPQTQDECRDGDNALLKSVMKMCDSEGIGYFVLVTISKKNLGTLKKTVEFLEENRIPMVRSPFVLRGAASEAKNLQFSKSDMESSIHQVLRENPLCYVSHTPFFASPEALKIGTEKLGVSLNNLGCQAGRTFIGISAEGDVAPCVHLLDTTVNCGNVRHQRLSELYWSNSVLVTLRGDNPVKGKCSKCRYGNSCRGCRALAYYATGDYLSEDPTCFFNPLDRNTRSEFEEIQTQGTYQFIEFITSNDPWKRIFGPSGFSGRVAMLILNSVMRLRRFWHKKMNFIGQRSDR